jgi:hypothetical protein
LLGDGIQHGFVHVARLARASSAAMRTLKSFDAACDQWRDEIIAPEVSRRTNRRHGECCGVLGASNGFIPFLHQLPF